MQQSQLTYNGQIINYYIFGTGKKTLFCLHGYGEEGSSFAFFEKHLGHIYTLYAIDFPFHGETKWNEENSFNVTDLVSILYSIRNTQTEKFSLLAYSMGGRAAMHLLQLLPQNIERVVLIAPDGLHVNSWYWFATQTYFGNKLFAYTMQNPRWFFAFLNAGGKLHLYNNTIKKFVHYYLDHAAQRTLLYKRWTYMRKMKTNRRTVKKLCGEKNIRLNLLFGKYDRIILSKHADIFKNAKNIRVKILDAGHQLMKEKYAGEIATLLID
jgi:pimeloyl-ACP methyl ester carboxylesterase